MSVHHFLSPEANAHKQMIQVWADRVAEQSSGKIAFEIFPAMSLGGKPPELYSQVRDGTADIVWTVLGYTPRCVSSIGGLRASFGSQRLGD